MPVGWVCLAHLMNEEVRGLDVMLLIGTRQISRAIGAASEKWLVVGDGDSALSNTTLVLVASGGLPNFELNYEYHHCSAGTMHNMNQCCILFADVENYHRALKPSEDDMLSLP